MTREEFCRELQLFRHESEMAENFYDRVVIRGIRRHQNGAIPHDWREQPVRREVPRA